MKLKKGAEHWLIGKYLIHQGDNSRRGAVMKVESIENRLAARCPKSVELVIRVRPEPAYWPETAGDCVSSITYALRNVPDGLLEMDKNERQYYNPIFALFDVDKGQVYTVQDLSDGISDAEVDLLAYTDNQSTIPMKQR
ncbi:hypothetical protein [Marinobacterium sp. BA1]|uniref:hypothetical protein n=1 Tax=Marinobacterium sp. BA1 TaxID=3138931 RepID=UPI0032E54D9E